MQTLIDILAAIFIGGILLLVAMTAMDSGLQMFVNYNADALVQNELAELANIIQEDLRKMGYAIPQYMQDQIIQTAQPNQLAYIANLNLDAPYPGYAGQDAVSDTVRYNIAAIDTVAFVDTSLTLYGVNRTLHLAGKSAKTIQVGTIANDTVFQYLNQVGQPVAVPMAAKMVEVTFVALTPDVYLSDELLAATNPQDRMRELRKLIRESFWRQTRVISKNLRR